MTDQPARPERRPLYQGPRTSAVPEWWTAKVEPDPEVQLLAPSADEQRVIGVLERVWGQLNPDGTVALEPMTAVERDGAIAMLRTDAGVVQLDQFGHQVRRRILGGTPFPPPIS